jgi:hypothetical protein
MPVCSEKRPLLQDVDGHRVACHLYGETGEVQRLAS